MNKSGRAARKSAASKVKEDDEENWVYRLQFDPSSSMKDFWVDSKTLRYLNKFRDNVFVS